MSGSGRFYKSEADYLLRENMNKLKGLVDLLQIGILDSLSIEEREEYISKIKQNMDSLYEKLNSSISLEE